MAYIDLRLMDRSHGVMEMGRHAANTPHGSAAIKDTMIATVQQTPQFPLVVEPKSGRYPQLHQLIKIVTTEVSCTKHSPPANDRIVPDVILNWRPG